MSENGFERRVQDHTNGPRVNRKSAGKGWKERKEVADVGGGMLIAWLEDADGNLIGLRQTPD